MGDSGAIKGRLDLLVWVSLILGCAECAFVGSGSSEGGVVKLKDEDVFVGESVGGWCCVVLIVECCKVCRFLLGLAGGYRGAGSSRLRSLTSSRRVTGRNLVEEGTGKGRMSWKELEEKRKSETGGVCVCASKRKGKGRERLISCTREC